MSLNILVVDDSAVMRAMIIKTLHMSGLPIGEIHQASNGQEGLAKMDENWIDLVLADINMPVMNGEEMLELMLQDAAKAHLPVIVISTEGSQTRIERIEQKGASFIHKPFTPETICEVIRKSTGVTNEQPVEQPASPDSY